MVLKRSWPAVSQICSLTRLPSSSMVLILKSMPMVVMNEGVNESSLKRSKQHDFPTPESPISRSLICRGVSKSTLELRCGSGAVCAAMGRCPWETYKEVIVPCPGHSCDVVCGALCVCVCVCVCSSRCRGALGGESGWVAALHPRASEGVLYWWRWGVHKRRRRCEQTANRRGEV